MMKITLDGNEYEYVYTAEDLCEIAGIAYRGSKSETGLDMGAMLKVCLHMIRRVEDNETNARLRFRLASAILGEIQCVVNDMDAAKNSVAPSPTSA